MSLEVREWDSPAPALPSSCTNHLPDQEFSAVWLVVHWRSLGGAYEMGTAMGTSMAVLPWHGLLQSMPCRYWCACTQGGTCCAPLCASTWREAQGGPVGPPFFLTATLFTVVTLPWKVWCDETCNIFYGAAADPPSILRPQYRRAATMDLWFLACAVVPGWPDCPGHNGVVGRRPPLHPHESGSPWFKFRAYILNKWDSWWFIGICWWSNILCRYSHKQAPQNVVSCCPI